MPWYVPWSENIKKRACRYLLQRYLGQFLEEKLTLDQLSVDLYNGTGTVCDVSLDCESLNELGEAQGWPIEFVDGFVQKVDVSIPWANILKDDSFVQVSGLSITIQPRQRTQPGTGMLESMWSSMTSSMQLATECLQQQQQEEGEEEGPTAPQPVEGIELFAQTIDSILCRVKVRFSNTTIRMEHVPKDSSTGVALEIHIKNIDYLDEAGSDPPTQLSEAEKNKTYVVSTFTTKKICFEGVTFHTDEFPSKARTFSRSIVVESSHTTPPSNQTSQENVLDHLCKGYNTDPVESLYESCTIVTSSISNDFKSDTTSGPSKEFPNISNVCTEPEPILFARLAGRQEMRIRIKQSEEALGPKVDFQLTLGSLAVLLSPRQFHILIELAEGLASPHLEDNSNMPCRSRGVECKPMRAMDFERVEAQLAGEIQVGGHHHMQHLLHTTHGWSSNNMGDSLDDDEEKFLPLRREPPPQADSLSSSLTSSMISNASSLPSLASTNTHQRKKRGSSSISEGDLQVEVSQVHIRIASLACVLLHEDILTLSASTNGECLAASSVKQMKSVSEEFFSKLGLFTVSGYGSRDLDEASRAFDEAVASNHIRLILAPLVVEGGERCNASNSCISVQLTAARLQLNECLLEDTTLPHSHSEGQRKFIAVPLLTFTTQDGDGAGGSLNPLCKTPDMKVYYKATHKTSRSSGDKKYTNPKIDVSINLEPCTIEVDISLMDRMCAVLNPQPLCRRREGASGMPDPPTMPLQDQQVAMQDNNYQVRVMCPRATVRLRFPIADLRPAHDMSRPAWWQRCVRKELLVGHLTQATFTLQPTNINIKCREINLYFSTEGSGSAEDIHLGSAIADEEMTHDDDSTLPTLAWPSLSISWIDDEQSSSGLLDSCSEGEGDQMAGVMGQSSGMLMDALGLRPGPFSSKKMVHESDTPHPKDDKDDTEELVIPGDAKEMKQFMEYSMKNSLLQIQCNLPVVSLQLDGKQLYELLYNRINSDLFMWEPCAPRPAVPPLAPHMPHHFTVCKSAINYNSDSDSSTSSSTDSNNLYYSTYDHKGRQANRSKQAARQSADTRERVGRINLTCFNLQIGKGLLTVYTPVRDSCSLVIPGQRGEMCVRVGALSMCHVAGVAGNPRRALLSLQATNAQLYHAGVVSCPDQASPLRLYSSSVPPHMRLTIHPSDKGVQLKQPPPSSRDQLSLAISIRPHKDYHHFKTIRVAAGVSNSTLNFAVCPAQHSVLNQIIDMFDVLDYPVPGYEPSTVITELHVHVWDCAIDYRPLKLPLRTVTTLGSFSVSSNVVAQSNASNLRFMAEECMLFLADGSSSAPANLRKDYIQVLDLGLFELSLRVNEKHISTAPRMDLRASNNVVHIRTCSDTFSALCRLINYLAGDGDLVDQHAESTHSVGDQTSDNILFGDDSSSGIQQEDIRELSKSQVQQVNDLMADAMEEQPKPDDGNIEDETEPTREGVEVFFFPDESKAAKLERESSSLTHASINSSATDLTGNNFADCEPTSGEFLSDDAVNNLKPEGRERLISFGDEMGPPIPVVARELGDYSVKSEEDKPGKHEKKAERKSSGDTDDEFCMLGDEILAAGSRGVTEPQVKWLVEGPPHVVDGHFSVPQGKNDILKPPKNFPMALFRYTLREMTVIWHMYGGRDFPAPQTPSHKRDDHRSTSLGPTTKHVTINTQSPTFAHRERDPYSVIPQSPGSWTGAVSYSKTGAGESVSVGASGGSGRGKAWTLMGGAGRRHDILMELQLNKVRLLHETYPPGYSESSRQVLVISSVEVRDRLASSQINKFLYQYTSEQRPKRKDANMVVVKAVHVRPEGSSSPPECCLKVSLLPLRFNIDQDALLFLISFFTQLSNVEPSKEGSLSSAQSGSSQSLHSLGGGSPRHPPAPPVMGVTPRDTDSDIEDSLSLKDEDEGNPLMRSYEAERLVSENLILLEEDWKAGPGPSRKGSTHSHRGSTTSTSQPSSTPEPDDAPVYFRNVVFSPEVPIRLDYQGKRVDLTHGPLAGLLMGLAQLNCSELKLKRLSYRLGLLGMEKLIRWALQEWLGDIKRRQLPGLLGGVGPMYSLLQLFQGIRDLFWLPIEQYQRDGRLVRGLQRGASSFTTSTAMAALDITARIVYLIQATAETAYDMVSPSPGLRSVRRRRRRDRAGQPQDIREGVSTAYNIVKEGLNETALALAEVAVSERAVRGYSGAVGGVLRQLPPTALAPLLLASAAASRLLGGVRASLQPPHHQEHSDKWRTNGNHD